MRILITNDDGINAPGLEVLTGIAEELAGPRGEVWTVAPAFEQSGVAHAISYTHPMMIARLGPRRYAAEGAAHCTEQPEPPPARSRAEHQGDQQRVRRNGEEAGLREG